MTRKSKASSAGNPKGHHVVGNAPKHPQYLSVTEVAEEKGVTRQGIIRAIEYGRLPAYMVGSTYIIPKNSIRFLKFA